MPYKSRRQPVSSDKRFRAASLVADMGTNERWQHSGRALELTERAGVVAARATEEHVLDSLALRGLIGEAQKAAGLKLRGDYQRAALAAPVAGSYSPSPGKRSERGFSAYERDELQEQAYRRWRAAVTALGLHLARPVLATSCFDQWPQAGDIALLRDGLTVLARYYRLPEGKEKPAK